MINPRNIWLTGLVLLLAAALAAPGLAVAKEEGKAQRWGVEREKLAKDLGLSPEKSKEFLAVGEKYDKSRQEVFDLLRKNQGDLEKAMAEPTPNEAKIKEAVAALTADHDKLVESFKAQRQEEMKLLTPVQQGKFMMALKRWHQEMCSKFEKKEEKKEEKK